MKYQSQETRPSLWQIVLAVCLIAAMIVFYASGASAQANATLSSYDLTYHPGRAEIDSSDWCPICRKATDRIIGVTSSSAVNTYRIKRANGDIEVVDPNYYTRRYTCEVCNTTYILSWRGSSSKYIIILKNSLEKTKKKP